MARHFNNTIKDLRPHSRDRKRNEEAYSHQRNIVRNMQRLVQPDTEGIHNNTLNEEPACSRILACFR